MSNVEHDEIPPMLVYTAVGLLVLCVLVAALVIAGSPSTGEGIVIVAAITVLGLAYSVLAVWSDELAAREEEETAAEHDLDLDAAA